MAVDWSKLTLLDDLDYRSDADGDIIIGRFYLLTADIASRPTRGDSGPSALSLDSWTVESSDCPAVAAQIHIVTVNFRPYSITEQSIGRSASELVNDNGYDYEDATILITPDMLGLRPRSAATDVDLTGISGDLAEWTPSARKGSAGNFAQITAAEWELTTYNPVGCPFLVRPHWRFLNLDVYCVIAHCYDYVSEASVTSAAFRGINTTSSIPAAYGVDYRTTAGAWRALGIDTETVVTSDGSDYKKVTRHMMLVPQIYDIGDSNNVVWYGARHGGNFTW